MTVLTAAEVKKIAHLARLDIDESAIPKYAHDLSSILDLVAQMNSIDTHDRVAMAHPLEVSQRLRPDVIIEVDQRERFQQIAPQVEAGLYLVPQVIE